jgi:hypothetical protein
VVVRKLEPLKPATSTRLSDTGTQQGLAHLVALLPRVTCLHQKMEITPFCKPKNFPHIK